MDSFHGHLIYFNNIIHSIEIDFSHESKNVRFIKFFCILGFTLTFVLHK